MLIISIHTTHVGGDYKHYVDGLKYISISIHTTHVGGDLCYIKCFLVFNKFQSTPPMWVVTKLKGLE